MSRSYRYKDIQLTVNIPDPVTGAPLNVVQNAGRADISGVEIDGVALLGDRWEVDLGAAYQGENRRWKTLPRAIDAAAKCRKVPRPSPLRERGAGLSARVRLRPATKTEREARGASLRCARARRSPRDARRSRVFGRRQ